MGWGTKKPAAPAPQPAQQLRRAQEAASIKVSADFAATRLQKMSADPALTQPMDNDEPVKEKPSDAAKAEIAWHQLKSRKGWTDASLVMLMHEFIKSRELFAELTKFVGRR